MGGLANGFVNLFKSWGKGIGKAADNFLLDAEARKAISDEVRSKFKPKIDLAREAENKRAANITDLDAKLNQAKQKLTDDQKAWQDHYNAALAGAKAQRQTEISNYNAQLKAYKKALNDAKADKDSIVDQLRASEATYKRYKTIYTDVDTGDTYILNPRTGAYETIDTFLKTIKPKKRQAFIDSLENFDSRLIDIKNNKVINAFNKSDIKNYKSNNRFGEYSNGIKAQNTNLMDAENQIKQADANLTAWQQKSAPTTWSKTDSIRFRKDFESNNGTSPTEYSFNGQTYQDATALDNAYQQALKHEEALQNSASKIASKHVSDQKAEIARRIQDAKDTKKAKLALGALGAGAGAGALFAGAKAMYGGDDTDNTDTTDNTYTGEPDPDFNVKNIPEGQAQLNDEQSDTAPINTGFDPDKADALAAAAYDKGVEDGNSIESSGDLGNNIGASTGGHTIDDRLFELIKAMQDPYKADAVANYIYSRRGNDPELQRLGWRAWLNKYYGDSLRSMMNIDPSGYNGMHISGGL